ncbi:mycofactocin-coupled SDR family oxidoreductase [Saccharopolyspora spinosa]|uniref:SDR family mycofactocin-dependent oxidoreductase n=1 Tax=Saccharopolyspora spinosa TaxID=60894 RepID=A0A2N3Y0F0_SACSN|nr:mycofactocin-coupled SDR family oxidoreductase [Saccharopolyspora spinosa]PKW16402.1 SDR family mycofactocin-dependent oxidoreductase [Saccharopolyspora spinosa]
MSKILEGQVAFVTGAARGQGRSHAVRLAQEGADVIAVDICAQISSVEIPMATKEDLDETVRLVEAEGRRIAASVADVRDGVALTEAVRAGVAKLGRLDIVCANAGIYALTLDEPTDVAERRRFWQDTIDVNLTGVWNTVEAAAPIMIEAGRGGAIILTASTAASKSAANHSLAMDAYTAAKHGVVGLMRNLAVDLASHSIRVNTVHPTGVHTPMVENEVVGRYMAVNPGFAKLVQNSLPVDAVDPVDISNAIVYLASDAARYVTGVQLPVDAGFLVK